MILEQFKIKKKFPDTRVNFYSHITGGGGRGVLTSIIKVNKEAQVEWGIFYKPPRI